MKFKCNTCKYFRDGAPAWCDKIKHVLQNGYAKKYHAERCGE